MSATEAQARNGKRYRPIIAAFGFATLWAVLISALVAIELTLADEGVTARTLAIVLMFTLGAFAGALFARIFAGFTSRFRPQPSARFASMLFGLITGTVGMTALLHFLDFRAFYAQWHSDAFTPHWLIELVMTSASSAYIFTVESTPLLLPWGLPLLLAAAWDYAATPVERK